MRKSCLAVLALGILCAQTVVKESSFDMTLAAGWAATSPLPPGFDRGFQKVLPSGEKLTLFLHYEQMPVEAGAAPEDTSDIQRQFETLVRNQYPDAKAAGTPAFPVRGKLLVNQAYELTDEGVALRRSYTYYVAGRTAFVVQCNAPRGQWQTSVKDFAAMLGSLKPASAAKPGKVPDRTVVANLKSKLPTLASSFPSNWSCSVPEVAIVRPASGQAGGTVSITLAFERTDIAKVYSAAKQFFASMKNAKSDADLERSIPPERRAATVEAGELMKYVGQTWGLAWGDVANCEAPVSQYRIVILGPGQHQSGAVSISTKDGAEILSGKVTASDMQRFASMYRFE